MRKKLIAVLLTMAMCLSLAACGSDKPQGNDAPSTEESTENDKPPVADNDTTVETPPADDNAGAQAPADGETMGRHLYQVFEDYVAANPDAALTDIANAVCADSSITFSPVTMEVEAGYLSGFSNAEIGGFEEGVTFAPMIGSIPFVGYVFRLADGADAESFKAMLANNADPSWNICVTADETVVENCGDKVFFLMCSNTPLD